MGGFFLPKIFRLMGGFFVSGFYLDTCFLCDGEHSDCSEPASSLLCDLRRVSISNRVLNYRGVKGMLVQM